MAALPPDPFPPHDPVRFPNTRRRVSTARTQPQDMPPPLVEPDTCRICRAEGSLDEPLFYPCKCSGSIKYVHQDCLMEWLSHSQKKHCELCKTPFRFTKLYDPNMPTALPTHIFLSHTARYLFRNLLVWLRGILVASVWLGWLPYLMRTVWSFLFWVSDEGFGSRSSLHPDGTTGDALGVLSGTNVCPASPLFAATTSVATIGGVLDSLPPDSAKLVRGLYAINLTSSDPIYSTVLRLLFGTVGLADKPAAAVNSTTAALARLAPSTTGHQSLLSDVSFLRDLTRHPSVNRVVIATLEGQLITVLVIVCFILIILVRDYVVQQQPEINMRAAFAAIENPPQPPAIQEEPAAEDLDVLPLADPLLPGPLEEDVEVAMGEALAPFDDEASVEAAEEADHIPSRQPDGSTQLPSPDSLAGAARPAQEFDSSTVHEYLDIYREADGDPEQILRIARERHLDVRLDYWMRLTRSMMDRRRDGEAAESSAAAGLPAQFSGAGDLANGPSTEAALVADELGHPNAGPLRPRANTDGPQINTTIHPLANNSWSFAGLAPPEPFPPPAPRADRDSLDGPLPDLPDYTWESPAESSSTAALHPTPPPTPPEDVPDDASQTSDVPIQEVALIDDARPRHDIQPAELPLRPERPGLVGKIADFMWREVERIPPSQLAHINFMGDFGDDFDDANPPNAPANQADRDRDVAEDAAGLDAEAIEDAEDLEGILELLGMRGPVAGLFQNAIFCAFLVSITIFVGIFLPYNLGRMAIWAVANPARIAQMLFSSFRLFQDMCVLMLGLTTAPATWTLSVVSRFALPPSVANHTQTLADASWGMAVRATYRVAGAFAAELPKLSSSELRTFSALSHEALLAVKDHVALASTALWDAGAFLFGGNYTTNYPEAFVVFANASSAAWEGLKALPTAAMTPSSWVVNLGQPAAPTAATVNLELASWGGVDRFWAVLAGYGALALAAGLYLRRGTPFSTAQAAQDWEASLIDGLNQASGVLKVILIISIEMLVFPLYCGVLLDVALLPLFEHATLGSRLLFALRYPVTSVFVHWFVGTGYMFHFALFVSMCRKIMRKGVLYFIRDPDDPEFHPVRDVLERSVATQLRKILFSAFVYGALVLVCLGGVVWGLSLSLPGVLPIHYVSNEPVLEFPVDLLFYNFLMPLAVRFFRPSDGLHAMYTWWFRRCARALRITWFLFGERHIDEEGRLVLPPDSSDNVLPAWRRLFLEIDGTGHVAARSYRGIFEGGTSQPGMPITKEGLILSGTRKETLARLGELAPDGRFVRSPASDQVKIPKGSSVFLEVSEANARLDGLPDSAADGDIYSSKQYQLVYVPPHFQLRVFFFILSIWIFAAVTGVGITIVPLAFGRWLFAHLIPSHIRTNDIYAFSIGIHVLGAAAYGLFRAKAVYEALRDRAARAGPAFGEVVRRVSKIALHTARVVYTYLFALVVFPLLLASLMELYLLMPLHEIMDSVLVAKANNTTTTPTTLSAPSESSGPALTPTPELNPAHSIRVVQTWTVGLLYLRLGARFANVWFEGGKVSNALRAVFRRGWLDPDAAILTRAFVVPAVLIWTVAVAAPLLLAKTLVADGVVDMLMSEFGSSLLASGRRAGLTEQALYDAYAVLLYRISFPLAALLAAGAVALWSAVGVLRTWQVRIRDEAYLIGERLHNFGGTNAAARQRGTAWRTGAARI